MKILLTITVFVVCLWSCSPEESIEITDAPIEREDQLSLKGLEIQFPDDLFNTEIQGASWEEKKANLKEGLKEGIFDAYDPESKTPDFLWNIEASEEAIIVRVFQLPDLPKNSLEKFSCPEGMSLYASCLSKSCASDKVLELSDHIAPGESFSVHRRLSSVKICASQSLIDKAAEQ